GAAAAPAALVRRRTLAHRLARAREALPDAVLRRHRRAGIPHGGGAAVRAAGNPFCAARFAPGVLLWIGELTPLVDRVCVRGARLQVKGPHGSGKSTLLVHLGRAARLRGWDVCAFRGSHGIDLSALIGGGDGPLAVFVDEAE